MKFTIRVDGVDYEVEAPSQALAQAIAQERARHDELLASEKARADAAEKSATEAAAKADAAAAKVAELQHSLETERDPKRRARDAAELQELVDHAKVVAGKAIDTAGTPHEIRMAALKAGGEDVMAAIPADRKEDSIYVDAYAQARFDSTYAARKDARSSVINQVVTPRADTDNIIITALKRRDAEREALRRQHRGLPARKED